MLCRVCLEEACGLHYGIYSCNGCKRFFKHTIIQDVQYEPCKNNEQCLILWTDRKKCQACHLKNCIVAGMSRDAPENGRVPERKKANVLTTIDKADIPEREKPDILAIKQKMDTSKHKKKNTLGTMQKISEPKREKLKIHTTMKEINVPKNKKPNLLATIEKIDEPKREKPKIHATLKKANAHKNEKLKIPVTTKKVKVPCTVKPNNIHAVIEKVSEPKRKKTKIHTAIKKVNDPKNEKLKSHIIMRKVNIPKKEKPNILAAMKEVNVPNSEKLNNLATLEKVNETKCKNQKVQAAMKKVNDPKKEKPNILSSIKEVNVPNSEKPNILAPLEKVNDHEREKPKIPATITKANVPKNEKLNILPAMEKVKESKRKKPKIYGATKKINASYNETLKIIPGLQNINDLERKKPTILDGKHHEDVQNLEKPKIIPPIQNTKTNSQNKDLRVELENELKLLVTSIKKALEDITCDLTMVADHFKTAWTQLLDYSSSQLICPFNINPHLINKGVICNKDLHEQFAPAILGVIDFAERIPCFKTLSQRDQDTLLKAGVFEVLLVRIIYQLKSRDNNSLFSNGPSFLSRDSIKTDSVAEFMLSSMFDLTKRMYKLPLSDYENWLFCSIVLIAADHPGLRNTSEVLKVQNKLIGILQESLSANHPDENRTIFRDLMKIIPDLRILNCLHSKNRMARTIEPDENKGPGTVSEIIEMITDIYFKNSIKNGNENFSIDLDLESQNNLPIGHPPVALFEERSDSPDQQDSGSSDSTIIYDWSTIDSMDDQEISISPRSMSVGDSSSNSYVYEDPCPSGPIQTTSSIQNVDPKRPAETDESDNGVISIDVEAVP